MALCLGNLIPGAGTAASALVLLLAFLVVAARLLPLFLGTQGKGLLRLGCHGATALFFEFCDALACRLKLPLRRNDEIDQPIHADPSLAHLLFELIDGVHAD